jgi:hypothetical protein
MDEMTDEDLARLFGWTRVAFGAVACVAPKWAARVWTGENIAGTTTKMALRSLGARDAALGLGLVIALRRRAPVRGWLDAATLSDAADFVNTLMCVRRLPKSRVLMGLASAGGAVALDMRLARVLD